MACSFLATIEVSTLLIVTVFAYFYWKYKDFPPGPWGIPWLGYALFLGGKPRVTLRDLGKKYGGIVSVNLVNETTVVVTDWKCISEVIVKQGGAFSSRPNLKIFDLIMLGRENHLVFTSGPVNKKLKRFSIQLMREFGMGRSSMESTVVNEVEKLSAHLKTKDGQLVDVRSMFIISATNIIWGMVAGNTFDIGDSEIKSLADAVYTMTRLINVGGILSVFPFLRFVAPELTGFTRLDTAIKKINAFMEKVVAQHLKDDDNNESKNNDFIYSFNEEIKKRRKENKDQPPYCKDYLIGTTFDLFGAGLETTEATLCWAFVLMAYHQDIQEKVQRELDQTIDKDSHISYSSKTKIPFTEATLCEIQRFITVAPLAVPHCAAKDATLLGYRIPKGTQVLTNLWALHHDEGYWGDPEKFRPERFLNEEGRLIKNERFIPFSAGPRSCLGESLARMELTLFFSCLLRRFSFQMDPNHPKPESVLEPKEGLILKPRPTALIVKCR